MFYCISGEVIHSSTNMAVVMAGGVGYAISTSAHTLGRVQKGKQTTLYTYLHVREDAVELFGFSTTEELSAFKMLISVTGVGPKAALGILSVNSPERLVLALLSGDERALTAAPGVGKKLAQRVILELKDKMGAPDFAPHGVQGADTQHAIPGNAVSEAQAALIVLGYTPLEAAQAVKGLDETMGVEEIIRRALTKTR
ncbi:MAG: Holliday junction branch migration protein RuvA [Oscillospiraceae bacterium]|jgi:Holliday junction DNA helicase RuvA|nr:Holliday junction branch migration protein RuvA [Oscillospiraceae bacterium]